MRSGKGRGCAGYEDGETERTEGECGRWGRRLAFRSRLVLPRSALRPRSNAASTHVL